VKSESYEITFYLPAQWEKRLDAWNKYLLPPQGERFVWVYGVMKSIGQEPIELYRSDFNLSYTLNGTERYTTTLTAVGNNDVYMWAPDQGIHGEPWNYGGVTDADGFGDRYVFSVPKNAYDFALEITSFPPISLTVR